MNDRTTDAATDATTYVVEGMSCDGCVRSLRAALERAAPNLKFDVVIGRVEVRGDHDSAVVRAAVDDAGFDNA